MQTPQTPRTLHQVWATFNERYDDVLALLPFHQHRLQHLTQAWDATMPNVLLYGCDGFPYFPFWQRLIYTPLGRPVPPTHFVRRATWGPSTSSSTNAHMPYYETDLYIHIELRHPNMPKDVGVFIDFLKHVLPSRCIHFDKHIVVLQDIDVLCRKEGGAVAVLKILLERFAHNVWFICTTHRIDALEGPIQSRFLCVRLPLPSVAENVAIVAMLEGREGSAGGFATFPVSRDLNAALLGLAGMDVPRGLGALTLSTSPAAIRKQAYALIQQDCALDKLCKHLITRNMTLHDTARHDTTRPFGLNNIAALCDLEVAFKTRRKGRDIIYYEAALALSVRVRGPKAPKAT